MSRCEKCEAVIFEGCLLCSTCYVLDSAGPRGLLAPSKKYRCMHCKDGELSTACGYCTLEPSKKPDSWTDQDGNKVDPPGPPKVGETWWVRYPGATALAPVVVAMLTGRVVTLRTIEERRPATYERGSVAFIELVRDKE